MHLFNLMIQDQEPAGYGRIGERIETAIYTQAVQRGDYRTADNALSSLIGNWLVNRLSQ